MNLPPLNELLAARGIFDGLLPARGLLQSNAIVPIGVLLGVWLVGGRFFRMVTGLVPVAIMVLFMLGSDPGVKQMFGGSATAGNAADVLEGGTAMAGSLSQQGWLLPACVIGGIFLLGRRRLSFIHLLLAILAVSYLLMTKDFRMNSVTHNPSSRLGMICIAGGLALFFLYRRFGLNARRYRISVPIGTQIASLKPVLIGAAIGAAGLFGLALLFQPLLIEKTFPAWRSTFGIWMLCLSLYAFNQSLPGKYRQWMMPAFWCVVCLVIGAQLTQSQFVAARQNPANIEQF